jgi:hypothetical protein
MDANILAKSIVDQAVGERPLKKVKRAWYGTHHHYSVKYMSLYISEACYKYNNRKAPVSLESALGLMAA